MPDRSERGREAWCEVWKVRGGDGGVHITPPSRGSQSPHRNALRSDSELFGCSFSNFKGPWTCTVKYSDTRHTIPYCTIQCIAAIIHNTIEL